MFEFLEDIDSGKYKKQGKPLKKLKSLTQNHYCEKRSKNRLQSLKDLKIKIKTQESDSCQPGESFELIQSEYRKAISGSQFIEDSILRERKFDKENLNIFKKSKRKTFQKK